MNPSDGNTFNHDELLARCVGRLDFMERILNSFELRFGEDLEQLEEHLKSSDADEVARLAHKMKGASANVAALCLNKQVAEIEQLARSQRLDEIQNTSTSFNTNGLGFHKLSHQLPMPRVLMEIICLRFHQLHS